VPHDVDWFAPQCRFQRRVLNPHLKASKQHAADRHLVDDRVEPVD